MYAYIAAKIKVPYACLCETVGVGEFFDKKMHMCIYTYKYVRIYVTNKLYVYVCAYIYTCVHKYICIHQYIDSYVYMNIRKFIYN